MSVVGVCLDVIKSARCFPPGSRKRLVNINYPQPNSLSEIFGRFYIVSGAGVCLDVIKSARCSPGSRKRLSRTWYKRVKKGGKCLALLFTLSATRTPHKISELNRANCEGGGTFPQRRGTWRQAWRCKFAFPSGRAIPYTFGRQGA